MIEETFPAHLYTIYGSKQSEFDPDYIHRVEVGLICPACKVGGKVLDHGEKRVCQCGARLQVFGNGLEVSK